MRQSNCGTLQVQPTATACADEYEWMDMGSNNKKVEYILKFSIPMQHSSGIPHERKGMESTYHRVR